MHIYIFLESHGNQGKLFLSLGDSHQSPGHNLPARERSRRPLVATSPTRPHTIYYLVNGIYIYMSYLLAKVEIWTKFYRMYILHAVGTS